MPAAHASKAAPSSATASAKGARRTAAKRPASGSARKKDVVALKGEIAATVHELQSIQGEIATVVRRMVSESLDAAITRLSTQEAVLVARDVGALALEAVQQVLRGTAQGIDEVLKSHRAAGQAATRRSAARKDRRASLRSAAG
jgi:hypothetical protein